MFVFLSVPLLLLVLFSPSSSEDVSDDADADCEDENGEGDEVGVGESIGEPSKLEGGVEELEEGLTCKRVSWEGEKIAPLAEVGI